MVAEAERSLHSQVARALDVDVGLMNAANVKVETRSLAAGETLVEKGDPVGDVFVILNGSLEIHGFDDQMLAVLEQGTVVGEVAVMAGGTRTATVRSPEESEVAVIAASDFERLVAAAPDLYQRISTEAIRRLDHRWLMEFITWLLGPVDPAIGDAISKTVAWRRVDAGEYLFQKGEKASGGYAVIRGRIRITGPAPEFNEHEVGKGALIGEEGLVAETDRSESALAVRDSVVVDVPRAAFLTLIEAYPKVVASVLANLMSQRTGLKRSTARTATTVLCADHARGTRFASQLASELGAEGFLSSERVDQDLDKAGVAQSVKGTPGDVRLSQALHEWEHEAVHTVYLADASPSHWSSRVTRQADNVVLLVPTDASEAEIDVIDEFMEHRGLGRVILVVEHDAAVDRPRHTARLASQWEPDLVLHVQDAPGRGIERLARLVADRATGLVLGGGGARGFAHLGVWRALREQGVEIDLIGGASMGAAVGALIARGGNIDELDAEVQSLFSGLLDYTLPLASLIKGKRIAKGIRKSMGDWDIEDLWIPYFCTSTNLTHSRVVVHERGQLGPAVRASVSIPGVLPPVGRGSDLLVDAGLLNNLPADIMHQRIPNGTVIAVDVAPPIGPGAHSDLGMSLSASQVLRSKFSRDGVRYPRVVPVLLRSMITASMRERDRNLDRGLVDLYLDLDMRGISLLDFEQAKKVIQAGYEASAPRIEAWLKERETDSPR